MAPGSCLREAPRGTAPLVSTRNSRTSVTLNSAHSSKLEKTKEKFASPFCVCVWPWVCFEDFSLQTFSTQTLQSLRICGDQFSNGFVQQKRKYNRHGKKLDDNLEWCAWETVPMKITNNSHVHARQSQKITVTRFDHRKSLPAPIMAFLPWSRAKTTHTTPLIPPVQVIREVPRVGTVLNQSHTSCHSAIVRLHKIEINVEAPNLSTQTKKNKINRSSTFLSLALCYLYHQLAPPQWCFEHYCPLT